MTVSPTARPAVGADVECGLKFPRTFHLLDLGGMTGDDLMLDPAEAALFVPNAGKNGKARGRARGPATGAPALPTPPPPPPPPVVI